jgi:hypothetical protein
MKLTGLVISFHPSPEEPPKFFHGGSASRYIPAVPPESSTVRGLCSSSIDCVKSGEGESAYGSPMYTGKDIRFTRKGNTLYAFLMAWPGDRATVTSLGSRQETGGKVAKVELLGHSGSLKFTQDAKGLAVTMPIEQPCKDAFVLKISGLKLNL